MRFMDTGIARCPRATVRGMDDADPRMHGGDFVEVCTASIRRTIIHDDPFGVGVHLRHDCIHGTVDDLSRVICGRDDGNQRHMRTLHCI